MCNTLFGHQLCRRAVLQRPLSFIRTFLIDHTDIPRSTSRLVHSPVVLLLLLGLLPVVTHHGRGRFVLGQQGQLRVVVCAVVGVGFVTWGVHFVGPIVVRRIHLGNWKWRQFC